MSFEIWHYELLAANDADHVNYFADEAFLEGGWGVPMRRALDAAARVRRLIAQAGAVGQVVFAGVVFKHPFLQRAVHSAPPLVADAGEAMSREKAFGEWRAEPVFGFDPEILAEARRRVVDGVEGTERHLLHLFDPVAVRACCVRLRRDSIAVCFYTGGPSPAPPERCVDEWGMFLRSMEHQGHSAQWCADASAYHVGPAQDDFLAARARLAGLGVHPDMQWIEAFPAFGSPLDSVLVTAMGTDKAWADMGGRHGAGLLDCRCGVLYEGFHPASELFDAARPGTGAANLVAINCLLESEETIRALIMAACGRDVGETEESREVSA